MQRDTAAAERLTKQAADLIAENPEEAERLLREALAKDLFYGPAHNNLGVVQLHGGELYEAATQFEWARKLMPGHPDPRLNLGLVYEQAGRIDEAVASYNAALEAYPGHLPSQLALASVLAMHRPTDASLAKLLNEIRLRGDTQWREWAVSQQHRLGSGSGG